MNTSSGENQRRYWPLGQLISARVHEFLREPEALFWVYGFPILMTLALGRGGDYADLFFEYNVAGSYSLEEGILKAAGRSVSMGLGVRVMKGDATGYAYVQELTPEAMQRAGSGGRWWSRTRRARRATSRSSSW